MDLKALETFVWVAHLGGFRTAADRLNATQPAISARIALLEEELGVRLFERENRRIALTEKGQNLLGYAERMLSLRSEMIQAVSEKSAIKGVIRLGVAESIVHTWLSRLVERLHYLYPAVSLEVEVDVSNVMREELLAHQLDIAFLVGPIAEPRLKSVALCSYELNWVASPSLPLPPEPVPLRDLARWPIITFSRNTRPYGVIQEMFADADVPGVRMFGNSSLATVVRMTLDGIGVSAIPSIIISRELAEGRLRTFRAEQPLPTLDFVAAYAKKPDSLMASTIVDLAVQVATSMDVGLSPR